VKGAVHGKTHVGQWGRTWGVWGRRGGFVERQSAVDQTSCLFADASLAAWVSRWTRRDTWRARRSVAAVHGLHGCWPSDRRSLGSRSDALHVQYKYKYKYKYNNKRKWWWWWWWWVGYSVVGRAVDSPLIVCGRRVRLSVRRPSSVDCWLLCTTRPLVLCSHALSSPAIHKRSATSTAFARRFANPAQRETTPKHVVTGTWISPGRVAGCCHLARRVRV